MQGLALWLQGQQLGLGFDAKVWIEPQVTVEPGAQGELSLVIVEPLPEPAWLLVRLSSPQVRLPENRLGVADVVDPLAPQPRVRARFLAPTEPGDYAVEGQVEYVTCERQRCRPRRGQVTWTVTVVEPAPDVVPQ